MYHISIGCQAKIAEIPGGVQCVRTGLPGHVFGVHFVIRLQLRGKPEWVVDVWEVMPKKAGIQKRSVGRDSGVAPAIAKIARNDCEASSDIIDEDRSHQSLIRATRGAIGLER